MARIMLVDDALFVRHALSLIVNSAGHEVVAEAGTGNQAVEQYQINRPDIVLMDITMPDMDGIEATKKIKDIDANAKIIMVSAMGMQEKVFAAIAAGAKDFVVKPFEESKIISCIAKYL